MKIPYIPGIKVPNFDFKTGLFARRRHDREYIPLGNLVDLLKDFQVSNPQEKNEMKRIGEMKSNRENIGKLLIYQNIPSGSKHEIKISLKPTPLVQKKTVRFNEISALHNVRCREVPLYKLPKAWMCNPAGKIAKK